jgi:hypothetical protein
MNWTAVHNIGQEMEMWSTVVVNLTAIFTGVIVAARWIMRRLPPSSLDIAKSVLEAFGGALTAALVSAILGQL